MKCFVALFCFYLLSLSVFPCHDGVECTAAKTEFKAVQHNHNGESEQCSPFCSCACCGIQIVVSGFLYFPELTHFSAFIEKQPSFYSFLDVQGNPSSIWQPPKLS